MNENIPAISKSDVDLKDLAEQINIDFLAEEAAARISLKRRRRMGAKLITIRKQVGERSFSAWLKDHFKGSVRTAYRRIEDAERRLERPEEAMTLHEIESQTSSLIQCQPGTDDTLTPVATTTSESSFVPESPETSEPVKPIVRAVPRFQCRPCRVNGQKADCKECADLNNEVRRPIEWSDPTLVVSPGPSTETYTRDPEPFPEEREETADPSTLSYKPEAPVEAHEPVQAEPPTIVPAEPASEPVSVEDLFDGCDFPCCP